MSITVNATASDLDPTDPYTREAQIFPRLSESMAARITGYGKVEALPQGTLVFERGQRSVDFFFVLEGNIEVFDLDDHGAPSIFTVHGERQFTGEIDLFNDREILVSGRAGVASKVVRVPRADFRRLVGGEPDIGEILMRAFILRRTGLILHRQGGVVLIGPGHGGDMLRLQRFLTRNGYPHRSWSRRCISSWHRASREHLGRSPLIHHWIRTACIPASREAGRPSSIQAAPVPPRISATSRRRHAPQ